jgi:Mce-associated membrane protein
LSRRVNPEHRNAEGDIMTVTVDEEPTTSAAEDIEEPSDAETEPAATDEADDTGLRRSLKPYAGVALAVAMFVAMFGAAGALGYQLWDQHQVTEAGQAARQTAINYAQALTSIDSNQLDRDFATVLNGATGEFKDTYTKASVQLRQLLVDNKATAHGTVVESAIQSQSKTKVVLLLMIDQTVSNTARPDSRVDRTRMKITMELVGGRWLASKVELP